MDVDLAESLFADLRANRIGFDTLILFWLGEPLLHPEFPRVWRAAIAAAEDGCFGKVELHTNATHLSSAYTAALLNDADVPQVMHFSLDATDVDRYRTVKGKDRYDVVVRNIEHFLEEKARTVRAGRGPSFSSSWGLTMWIRWAPSATNGRGPVRCGTSAPGGSGPRPLGRCCRLLSTLDCPTAAMQERPNAVFREAMTAQGLAHPQAAEAGETVQPENQGVCAGFWKSPVISWDGAVTTCTRDSTLHNSVGRITETPFSTLWWNETMRRRRMAVAAGDYGELKLCQSCFIPKSLNYTGITTAEIRAFEDGQ